MTSQLPSTPSLEQLRKKAKSQRKAHENADASCCSILRHLRQFKSMTEADILKADISLHDIQFALAIEYGFTNWSELKQSFDGKASSQKGGKLRREGNRVWIEGVPTLSWGRHATSYIGALTAALSVTEYRCSANDLMGFSGLAFRTRWRGASPGWSHGNMVGESPETAAAITAGTGWVFGVCEDAAHSENPNMEQFAHIMRGEIDAGRPFVGFGQGYNCSVCLGYTDNGTSFLWRDYDAGSEMAEVPVATMAGFWFDYLKEHRAPPSKAVAIYGALKVAIKNWDREDDRRWGKHALNTWRSDISEAKSLAEEERGSLFFANWWGFTTLSDARGRAVRFLRDYADASADPNAVRRAADLYAEEFELCRTQFGTKDAFLGPWSGKELKDWDDATRQREQEVLARILKLETAAMAELEAAFAVGTGDH